MATFRITMDIEAEDEDDAELQFNENIPEFGDFSVEEIEE